MKFVSAMRSCGSRMRTAPWPRSASSERRFALTRGGPPAPRGRAAGAGASGAGAGPGPPGRGLAGPAGGAGRGRLSGVGREPRAAEVAALRPLRPLEVEVLEADAVAADRDPVREQPGAGGDDDPLQLDGQQVVDEPQQ